ncbi:MAG: hypothetical protein R2861_04355 [Desulfobacterales bacterium]
MLGAGGAARAIAFTLAQDAGPAAIEILDINEPVLGQLRTDLAAAAGATVHVTAATMTDAALTYAMAAADIDPLHGRHVSKEGFPLPRQLFQPDQVVFDIVYTPLRPGCWRMPKPGGSR